MSVSESVEAASAMNRVAMMEQSIKAMKVSTANIVGLLEARPPVPEQRAALTYTQNLDKLV